MKKFTFNFAFDHTPKGGKRIGICYTSLVDEDDPQELSLIEGIYKVFDHSKSHSANEIAKELVD